MADKRMFSKSLIQSDRFSALSPSEQMLYIRLSLEADDDGFVDNARTVTKVSGCNIKSLKSLINNGYLIEFPSGVVAITHWRVNNLIRADRYKPTVYQAERARLISTENGMYSMADEDECGIPPVYQMTPTRDTEVSIGKDSIGKGSIDTTTKTTTNTATDKNTSLLLNAHARDASESYSEFLDRVFAHFEQNGYYSSPTAFIKYNESRGWVGIGGEDIRGSLDDYAWQWEKNERFYKSLPLDTFRQT